MQSQEVTLTELQRMMCAKFHLTVKAEGDGFVVIDRDPILAKKKKGAMPRHVGADLNALIAKARVEQAQRNGETVPEVIEVAPEPEVTNVVSIRRAALTPEEMTAPKVTLTNVILDNTGMKTRTPKEKVEKKHRDNRLARAFRAIIENPEMTIAEQAVVADVTEPMLVYYEIQLRSVYKIIAEKHGDDVIPPLPTLKK